MSQCTGYPRCFSRSEIQPFLEPVFTGVLSDCTSWRSRSISRSWKNLIREALHPSPDPLAATVLPRYLLSGRLTIEILSNLAVLIRPSDFPRPGPLSLYFLVSRHSRTSSPSYPSAVQCYVLSFVDCMSHLLRGECGIFLAFCFQKFVHNERDHGWKYVRSVCPAGNKTTLHH